VPGNRGLAFVEFTDERNSSVAMNKLQGHKVDNKAMHISFQKRVD
jgi:RNA recognition motif-containing protein